MSIVVEIEDALNLNFNPDKNYPVTKDFDQSQLLGTARVRLEKSMLVADFNVKQEVTGYPSIMYRTVSSDQKTGEAQLLELIGLGIASQPNTDEQIQEVTLKP